MTYTYVNGGWLIIIPTTVQIIIYIAVIYLAASISAYTREKHLIKHHLPEMEKSEIQKLRHENKILDDENKKLQEEVQELRIKNIGILQIIKD